MQRGFTLLEIMIALLIFSIGMMAVMTMNFSAINAYTSSRDQTFASDLGYRALELFKAEAGNNGRALYAAGDSVISNPFNEDENNSLYSKITTNEWVWQVVTPTPVNEQLNPRSGSFATTNARFCMYAQGGDMNNLAGAAVGDQVFDPTQVQVLQLQVAVVYPSNNQQFPDGMDCGQLGTVCAGGAIGALLNPAPIGTAGSGVEALETCGLRAVHMSGIVRRNIPTAAPAGP
jgi:prepilin-type N-terminal cleavage/methylation domain-containing protein